MIISILLPVSLLQSLFWTPCIYLYFVYFFIMCVSEIISKQEAVCRSFYLHPLLRNKTLDTQLQEEKEARSSNPQFVKMMEFRQKLPSYNMREVGWAQFKQRFDWHVWYQFVSKMYPSHETDNFVSREWTKFEISRCQTIVDFLYVHGLCHLGDYIQHEKVNEMNRGIWTPFLGTPLIFTLGTPAWLD